MEFLKRIFIFTSLVLFSLSFAISIGALLTDFWIETNNLERNGTQSNFSYVHSGLFHGTRQIEWAFAPKIIDFSGL